MQLKSSDPDFGGLSGLRLSADGSRFTAISDRGNWFTGAIDYEGSRPTGVSNVEIAPTPGRDGKPLPDRRGFDTEALEIEGRTAWVTAERVHWLTRYELGPDGRPEGAGKAVALPPASAKAPSNSGYEAMARLASGEIALIGEKFLDDDGDNRGFVVGGKKPFEFSVVRSLDFSPTDLVRLPGGDLVLLERRYKPPFSLSIRLRRLSAKDIEPGATLDGPVLMEASLVQRIDNFEALGVHRSPDGRTVLTLVSDDNFSPLQKTLLLQFALPD
ncbi:esterase-like activity of phytase family protein [Chenggangzhangella methanolivorans]|uniref:Esterase-like activity of phytase family protein n=1 Tax=Chenggangzhangella methanolivorans TaxID=1437009 RepID=A0A9E6R4Z9_9HYPH|nr:esterase-like activity of phytase family protein [Chenggangzhangella methanolivorans]QZN98315.1 esterase-like activity of phytase family protein [Chenggangzhangella methanolivorans]